MLCVDRRRICSRKIILRNIFSEDRKFVQSSRMLDLILLQSGRKTSANWRSIRNFSDPLGNLDELSAVSSRSRELDTESIHLTVHDQEDKPLLTDDNSNTTSIKGLLALLKDAPKGKEARKLMLQKVTTWKQLVSILYILATSWAAKTRLQPDGGKAWENAEARLRAHAADHGAFRGRPGARIHARLQTSRLPAWLSSFLHVLDCYYFRPANFRIQYVAYLFIHTWN